MGCGSPRAGCGRRGGSSGTATGRTGRSATASACARSRRGSGPSGTSTSSSRRPSRTSRSRPSPSSGRSLRCSPPGAASATTPGCCSLASSTATPTCAGSTSSRISCAPRAWHRLDPAHRAAPHPRDGRVAHLGRLRAGARLRAGHALGRRRDAPRAADHVQVAALHAGVRAGVPRTRLGHAHRPRGGPPGPPGADARRRCRRVDDPGVPRRGAGRLSEAETAAIGRYLVDREREVVRLRRTVGPTWRAIVGVAFRRGLGRAVAAL